MNTHPQEWEMPGAVLVTRVNLDANKSFETIDSKVNVVLRTFEAVVLFPNLKEAHAAANGKNEQFNARFPSRTYNFKVSTTMDGTCL